ncbi:MAG: hypothetical protein R3298_00875 [Gammaproteobacteria bacterium]|nr:hypothetical protein [Gammaproteobacteria bacterium]
MKRHSLLIPAVIAALLTVPSMAAAGHRDGRASGAYADSPKVVRADLRHGRYLDVRRGDRHEWRHDRDRRHGRDHRHHDRSRRHGHETRYERLRRLGPVFVYGLHPGHGHDRFRHHRGPGPRHRHGVPHRHGPRRHAPRPGYGWSLWFRW